MHPDLDTPVRLGSFELDIRSRELRVGSTSVRLQEQPFELLRILLERRGQVVTRDELRQRLWPDGTFVDFEHSLNAAIKRLRTALGDDADNPRFVETVPRRGYRFIGDQDDDRAPDAAAGQHARLAVLPFIHLGHEPDQDYFSDGLTDEMISELGRRCRGRVGVISGHSSRSFKGLAVRAREIGAALRADYLLEGSVRRAGDRVRITARLVNAAHETQLWADTYEYPLIDSLSVQAEVAAQVAKALAMELMPEERGNSRATDARTYQTYLKGRYHWQRTADSGAELALGFFHEAAARDPSFAAAHAGVAIVEVLRAAHYHEVPRHALEKARVAAERAVKADPSLSEGHVALGEVFRLLDRDARAARAAYARAIALNPSYEGARAAHAKLLATIGRFAQAIREADLGRDLDPRCLTMNTLSAWTRYVAGDYDSAADLCRHTLEMDECYLGAQTQLGAALLAAGSPKEALRVLEGAVDTPDPNPVAMAWLAHARATMHDVERAADLMTRLDRAAERRYVSPYHLALAYVGLADHDRAFAALERACDECDPWVGNVTVEPRFLPLRTDARFEAFLRRVGLAEFHPPAPARSAAK